MPLSVWTLLLDEELPTTVREALRVANRSGSSALTRRALQRAACGLIDAYGLTVAEAAELTVLDARRLQCGPCLKKAA